MADRLGEPLPALLELRCVSPHPTHNGRMGQRQAALGHHLHQVSQAQLEAKIPAHAQDDYLAVKVATLEQLLDAHQLAHAHPSGSSADIIAGQILPFAPEPSRGGITNARRGRRPSAFGAGASAAGWSATSPGMTTTETPRLPTACRMAISSV